MNAWTLADIAAAISRSAELALAVKATIALAAGLTIAAAASRARSSVRHLVLAATLGTLVALPVASAFTPSLAIVVPVSTSAVRAAPVDPAGNPPAALAPRAVETSASAIRWKLSIATTLRSIWAAGAVLLLTSLLTSMWRLNRIRRTAVPWLDTPPSVAAIAARGGDSRAVDVLLHEDVAAPLTCGILRPAIIFPPDAREWSEAEIGRAVVHELEHVKRADWAVQIAAHATCAAYWFHPLAWVALRKLSLEAERTCDDAVVRRDERTEYAEQLVSLAQRLKQASTPPVLAMASRSDLSRRVTALLDAKQRRGPAGIAATVVTAVVAIAAVAAIAPLRAVEAAATSQQAQSAALRGNRALYRASERGDVERIASLIAAGADVNAAIEGDGSPLIGAARSGKIDAVRLLLDRGADPNLGVEGDGNPLIMAAARGHLAVVDLLLQRGAVVDQVVDGDENALIQASGGGHLEVVRFLVGKGADVNARVWADSGIGGQNGEWRTPLEMARRGRHAAVVAFLRSAGARE